MMHKQIKTESSLVLLPLQGVYSYTQKTHYPLTVQYNVCVLTTSYVMDIVIHKMSVLVHLFLSCSGENC